MSKPSKTTDDTHRPAVPESSALDSIEAAKAKQNSLRERLAARRQKTKNLLASIGTTSNASGTKPLVSGNRLSSNSSTAVIKTSLSIQKSKIILSTDAVKQREKKGSESTSSPISEASQLVKESQSIDSTSLFSSDNVKQSVSAKDEAMEDRDSTPTQSDSSHPIKSITEPRQDTPCPTPSSTSLDLKSSDCDLGVKPTKIRKIASSLNLGSKADSPVTKDPPTSTDKSSHEDSSPHPKTGRKHQPSSDSGKFELEDLLGAETAREKENKRVREEIMELLNRPTTKERSLNAKFRSQGGSQVQQFCSYGTRIECSKQKARAGNRERCTKLHFRKIIHPHTDESLGDCSFLNTCFHVDTCKYVHYTIDYTDYVPSNSANRHASNRSQTANDDPHHSTGNRSAKGRLSDDNTSAANPNDLSKSHALAKSSGPGTGSNTMDPVQSDKENGTPLNLYPPQWINCDIRLINMSILGKFSVIMADPPWDIHMELPYGTMSDDEMRRLDIPCLQDDGYLFLWVTGRAMELGRECLRLWGYQRVDEIIWVKTNQLQRLIRTGRTGHWLNHGKEHCLVGVKGNPQSVNRGLDCDIIVSEVRETSHKPDEIYGIIERLSPGTRKLELFGRPHNLQPNWITLGNQLDGTYLVDPAVVERFKKHYPNGIETKTK